VLVTSAACTAETKARRLFRMLAFGPSELTAADEKAYLGNYCRGVVARDGLRKVFKKSWGNFKTLGRYFEVLFKVPQNGFSGADPGICKRGVPVPPSELCKFPQWGPGQSPG